MNLILLHIISFSTKDVGMRIRGIKYHILLTSFKSTQTIKVKLNNHCLTIVEMEEKIITLLAFFCFNLEKTLFLIKMLNKEI